MATIVNNPPSADRSDSSMGFFIGTLVIIILGVLFFAYALPAIRGTNKGTNINVPDHINVDVNQK